MSTADQQSTGMAWARWSAVLVVVVIGVAAFVLSFAALRDLAIKAHTPEHLAWLFPVIVDGTIIQATVAVLALRDGDDRKFFEYVLAAGAAVSIGGNIAHALVSGHGIGAAVLAVIAPAALLIDTHGLAILLRTRREQPSAAPVEEPDSAPAETPEPDLPVEPASVPASAPANPIPAAPVRPMPPRVPIPQPVRTSRPMPVRPVAVPTAGGN
ncbi:DUF2637 domain-containing protein [Nocardia cyriacigeorgica]|uniref:DUF2637 domain-containing protein n=1 Tax=Nocardia cyriacigeorgica TaxID=135487 RepID=UPI00245415F4|nr:DUF2637 domain-containing protein [Nocardia cyriacigeorgica]